jgi:ABC-type multidrug transport system ATPase subunit
MESASRWENSTEKLTDPEIGRVQSSYLINDVIQNYGWKNINVQVKDRTSGEPLSILSDANGIVHAGEMIAIMGPSGSGKTTLLNAIAHRVAAAKAITTGDRLANGEATNLQKLRDLSSYVEQDDALIGSLTVRETIEFAAGLSLPR